MYIFRLGCASREIKLKLAINFYKDWKNANLTGSTATFLDDFNVSDVTMTRSTVVQRPAQSNISLIKYQTQKVCKTEAN